MMLLRGNFKKDGFDGQRAIVIPKSLLNKSCLLNKVINKAYITDIGYYPRAKFHYRERANGSEQNILIYCTEGEGLIKINKISYPIRGGDFVLIPNGTPHSYQTSPENPWTIYWCHFKGEQSDELIKLSKNSYSSLKGSIPFSEARINLFNSLYDTLVNGYSFENLTSVNIIFPQLLSSFIFKDHFKPDLENLVKDMIELSFEFMQENLHEQLTLSMIAKHVNSSTSHFSSVFKRRTGFPPIEYLNHMKVQKACQFLQFTNLRIKEIAFKLGIDDQYYFSRLFTKIMAVSPTDYRLNRISGK